MPGRRPETVTSIHLLLPDLLPLHPPGLFACSVGPSPSQELGGQRTARAGTSLGSKGYNLLNPQSQQLFSCLGDRLEPGSRLPRPFWGQDELKELSLITASSGALCPYKSEDRPGIQRDWPRWGR